MTAFLTSERNGAILTLTMSQPETRNALTGNTAVEEFVQACADIARDPGIRVLVLTGAGPVFSSGGNVKDMQRYDREGLSPEGNTATASSGCPRRSITSTCPSSRP